MTVGLPVLGLALLTAAWLWSGGSYLFTRYLTKSDGMRRAGPRRDAVRSQVIDVLESTTKATQSVVIKRTAWEWFNLLN